MHAVAACSTCRSQKWKTSGHGALLQVMMSKKCTPLVARSTFRSQNEQKTCVGTEVVMSKKCTPLWREAHFECKKYNTPVPDHFLTLRCRKNARKTNRHGALLQVVVSKKCTPLWREVQNTSVSDHFWKLRCRKSARRCGANHISNQNEQNTSVSEHFWKGDVEKVHAVVARSTFRSQNEQNTSVGTLLEVVMSKKCTPLWCEAHVEVKM